MLSLCFVTHIGSCGIFGLDLEDFRAQNFVTDLGWLEQPGLIVGKMSIREEAVSMVWSLGPVGKHEQRKPLRNACESGVVVLGGNSAKTG